MRTRNQCITNMDTMNDLYMILLEKHLDVFGTTVTQREPIMVTSLDRDYLADRLSWYNIHGWKTFAIYKIDESFNPASYEQTVREVLANK